MPTTYPSFIIGVKGSTAITVGSYVKVTNFKSGGTIREQAKSGGEVVLNPATAKLVWAIGDNLSIEISGVSLGSASATISKGGVRATVTVATVAGPTISS